MENNMEIVTTPIQTASPMPNPIPTPMPMDTPAVSQPPIAPVMAEGGSVSGDGDWMSFIKRLNWLEIGIGVLSVTALFWVIKYYRTKIKEDKLINNELQRQLDEHKINILSAMKEVGKDYQKI